MEAMKLSLLLLVLTLSPALTAGDLYQAWSMRLLDAYIDNTVETASTVPGMTGMPENFVVVSLATLDQAVHGFAVNVSVRLDDGSLMSFYRQNVPVNDQEIGKPVILKFSTGSRAPQRVLLFMVQRLITDFATPLIRTTIQD